MFKPLALFIGLRYTRARKKSHFVSFISFTSMLGIGLGVMVLVTVLSVMNGFDDEIHHRFFDMAPEITVTGDNNTLNDWKPLAARLQKVPGVRAVAPYAGTQGLLTFDGEVTPVVVTGIIPELEDNITHLGDKLLLGQMSNLNHFRVILGRGLADGLGVFPGEKVTLMVPEATVTPTGMVPRFKRMTVEGIFSAGSGFNFDTKLVFMHLSDVQKLMQIGDGISGLKLKIDSVYDAPHTSDVISHMLGEGYHVGNWTQEYGAFFEAVKMEKTMMFLILLLIIAVAAFNLVSSLVMVVNDKQAEIAILRTLGATPRHILSIFIIQGMTVGILGTVIGLIAGMLLASNATAIVNALKTYFDLQILSSSVYFVDFLPSKIMWRDLWQVGTMALLMSFLATIYPAWRASKTIIAEALHHE